MLKYTKHLALLASFTLLCGCSGNAPESSQSRTSESELPQAQTAEIQSPAGETAQEAPASQEAQPAETAPADGSGVSLVSGGDSLHSDVFELNGTWCELTDLPFEIDSYSVPMLGKENHYFFGCFGKKLYFYEASGDNDVWNNTWSQDKLWCFDPQTGEEKLIYSNEEYRRVSFSFVNDQYLVLDYQPTPQSDNHMKVLNLQTGETVLDIPEQSGNIRYDPGSGVQIVYDMMYITGEYTMPEFGKSINVGLMLELNTGTVSLYDLNLHSVYYGVGNVCFVGDDYTVTSIHGETVPKFGDSGEDDDSLVWYNLRDTYFLTCEVTRSYDVLGSRNELFWRDRNNEDHRIGETAFSVQCPLDSFRMNRDRIFCATLYKELTTTVYNGVFDEYQQQLKKWLVLGSYEGDSAQAALLELDEDIQVCADNDCIYLVYPLSHRVSLVYKEG